MKKITVITAPTKVVRIDERTQIIVLASISDVDAKERYLQRLTPQRKPAGNIPHPKPDPDMESDIPGFDPIPEDTQEEPLMLVPVDEEDMSSLPTEESEE